ncbi:hypothetical protein [Natranaerobius trueperi]|nr:hypothetical protein [Natranaerobius trueperi]
MNFEINHVLATNGEVNEDVSGLPMYIILGAFLVFTILGRYLFLKNKKDNQGKIKSL